MPLEIYLHLYHVKLQKLLITKYIFLVVQINLLRNKRTFIYSHLMRILYEKKLKLEDKSQDVDPSTVHVLSMIIYIFSVVITEVKELMTFINTI